jgi:hypothetical protein
MNRVLFMRLKSFVKDFFLGILLALGVTVLVWFFCDILFALFDVPFLIFFRWTFVVLMVLEIITQIVIYFLNMSSIRKLSKKFEVSHDDVFDALFVYEFSKDCKINELSKDSFAQKLRVSRMVSNATDALFE